MSTSVVSGMDATPILEPGERVLDSVALPVEDWIVRMLCAVLGMRRNARRDAPIGQRLSEGGRTVGPVGEQEAGVRQLLDDRGSGLVIVGLSLCKVKEQWTPLVITDHLQLGCQPAPATSDTSG